MSFWMDLMDNGPCFLCWKSGAAGATENLRSLLNWINFSTHARAVAFRGTTRPQFTLIFDSFAKFEFGAPLLVMVYYTSCSGERLGSAARPNEVQPGAQPPGRQRIFEAHTTSSSRARPLPCGLTKPQGRPPDGTREIRKGPPLSGPSTALFQRNYFLA